MVAGSSKLASYFAPLGGGGSKLHSTSDLEVQKAIELSEAEARLSTLSEDELLQQALEASRVEMVTMNRVKRKRTASIDGVAKETIVKKPKNMTIFPEKEASSSSSSKEVIEQPVFTAESFKDESFGDKEEIINRLNGSLDLVYCKGWIRREERLLLREWMLKELTWHRVSYTSLRTKQKIITPRFTATFGKDDTGAPDSAYPVKPKPIPSILDRLLKELEKRTGSRFNTIIINYYQDGKDSISYHADDESFLGPLPTIASISLGSSRDFYLRRKFSQDSDPRSATQSQFYTKGSGPAASRLTEKMKFDDGDLIIMRGKTQSEWEHSIPKRANAGGRINLTFRKVVSVKGTNNFQRYNRGLSTDDDCQTYRWNIKKRAMLPGEAGI